MKHPWLWLLSGCLVVDGVIGYYFWHDYHERNHDKVIVAAARRYGLEPALIKAVVWRESFFDHRAKGKAGEIGLMQLTEAPALEWAESEHLRYFQHNQLYDPSKNTLAGSWYLRKLLSRYKNTDNPLAYALADYNAGRTHVLRWAKGRAATNSVAFIKQIDYRGTQDYVQSVLRRYTYYQPKFPPAGEKN